MEKRVSPLKKNLRRRNPETQETHMGRGKERKGEGERRERKE